MLQHFELIFVYADMQNTDSKCHIFTILQERKNVIVLFLMFFFQSDGNAAAAVTITNSIVGGNYAAVPTNPGEMSKFSVGLKI